MNQFSLAGRVALVTGGNQGLGLAFATSLAEAGASVAVFDITPPSPEFTALSSRTTNVAICYYTVDVSSPTSLEEGFTALQRDFGGQLDICIPCAGVNCLKSFLETTLEDFDRIMSINVRGVYSTVQMAARMMVANGTRSGSIIFVSSISASIAIRTHDSSAYASSKSAVRGLVPEVAKELARHGIRVNAISPGYTLTEMTKGYPDIVNKWRDDVMLGRVATPQDYCGMVVYLASDASRYVTGQDFVVDGGVTKW